MVNDSGEIRESPDDRLRRADGGWRSLSRSSPASWDSSRKPGAFPETLEAVGDTDVAPGFWRP